MTQRVGDGDAIAHRVIAVGRGVVIGVGVGDQAVVVVVMIGFGRTAAGIGVCDGRRLAGGRVAVSRDVG